MEQIITNKIWDQITNAAKSTKQKSYVAVAYFGKGGSSMLPLKAGSKLIIDASDLAVKTGQTCPSELLLLYNRGVLIYSQPFLHAKVFVFGTKLFIGSTNVSGRSANSLIEAAFTSTNKNTVKQARDFIENLCKYELGPEQIKRLISIYKPPVVVGVSRRTGNSKNIPASNEKNPKMYVANLHSCGYSGAYEQPLKAGRRNAKIRWGSKDRHRLDEFQWHGKIPFAVGDFLMQVTVYSDKYLISPPGRVIHVERWKDDNESFVFLEVPNKRRKEIKMVSKSLDRNLLLRNGVRSNLFTSKALSLWK